jgi:hypothetical protein
MASPSEAEVQAIISNGIKLLNETRKFGNVNATNWVSLEDTFVQSLEGDGPIIERCLRAVASARAQLAGTIDFQRAAAIIGGGLGLYARHTLNKPGASPDEVFDRLYERFIDNTLRVTSRQFTFGTPTADGSNTGNGTILRLNKDERNFDLENQHADAKRAWCSADGNSGRNRHEEEFTILGQAGAPDALQVSGSGATGKLRAQSANQSLLLNPSLDQFSGTSTAPTEITSWTSSVTVNGTNYTFDSTNYYRSFIGAATPYAANLRVTANLTQKLSVRKTQLDPKVPYMLQVAWNRQVGAASGTLTIRMGAANNNVVAAAQTGWQLLRVPSSPGQNNWFRNFNEDELDIAIEWSRTGGEILIDDVLLIPATKFDGAWYWAIGGTTPWLNTGHDGDFFTWSDSEVGSVLQYWFWRVFGRYLPHTTGGGVTWADP